MLAVGGRMEEVAPRRSLFKPDYVRLLVLAVVSVGIHTWIIGHTAVTARDSVGFARYALGIQSPESYGPQDKHRTGLDVIKAEKHPPGYPIAVWITAKFVRKSTSLPLPDSTLMATQVVSAISALLLVIPMYLLGRMLFGRNVAFAAALLFQVLPIPARITSDGLTDATYLFGAATALAIGVRAVRRPTIGGFLMCGMATGMTYLVRPEGLAVGLSVGIVIGWLGVMRKWPRDAALGRFAALGVGVALMAVPYMILINGFSNKPSARDAIPSLPGPLRFVKPAETGAIGSTPLFASFWILPEGTGYLGAIRPAVTAALKETSQGLHYLGAALAAFGIVALRRRIAADPGVGLLAVTLGVSFGIACSVGIRGAVVNQVWTHYVSERHVMLIVLIGCVFAAAGLRELAYCLPCSRECGRKVALGVLAVFVVTSIPPTLKPIHGNREGHKEAGRYLQQHLQHEDCLIDPFEWAGCYSERTLHYVFPDPTYPFVTYAVVDDKARDEDHARLPRMKQARDVATNGYSKLVYHWPPGPKEDAKVKVYQLVNTKLVLSGLLFMRGTGIAESEAVPTTPAMPEPDK